jgi:hypothetical protein
MPDPLTDAEVDQLLDRWYRIDLTDPDWQPDTCLTDIRKPNYRPPPKPTPEPPPPF